MAGIGSNIFAGGDVSLDTGSSSSSGSLANATYGPAAAGSTSNFSPRTGHGAGFWLAVGGVALLIFIRQSLPR